MLETLDYTIRIGSTPTFLYFDLYKYIYAYKYIYRGWPKKVAIIENMVNVVYLLLENRKICKVIYF